MDKVLHGPKHAMTARATPGYAVLAAVVLLGCAGCADRLPPAAGWGTERVILVAELPDEAPFRLTTGEPLDVGYVYRQVHLFWVPIWNYGGRWCGHVGDDTRYAVMDPAQVHALAARAGVTLPESPALPWWDRAGGKLAFAAMTLALILFFAWGRGRNGEAPESGTDA